MTRKQATMTEIATARDEARVHMHLLSMGARQRFFDLEAELDTIEHRLQAGGEQVTDALLQTARELARSLRALLGRQAA